MRKARSRNAVEEYALCGSLSFYVLWRKNQWTFSFPFSFSCFSSSFPPPVPSPLPLFSPPSPPHLSLSFSLSSSSSITPFSICFCLSPLFLLLPPQLSTPPWNPLFSEIPQEKILSPTWPLTYSHKVWIIPVQHVFICPENATPNPFMEKTIIKNKLGIDICQATY